MRAIVRKFAQRKAIRKPSSFRVRGQEVDYLEMVRYFARKGISIDDMMTRQRTSPTPEAVICITPLQLPISTPKVYAIPESIFSAVRDYINGSFDSGTWIKTGPTEICYSIKEESDNTTRSASHYLNVLDSCSWEARHLSKLNEKRKAKKAEDAAIAALRHVLPREPPRTLVTLSALIAHSFGRYNKPEVACALIQTVTDSGTLLLGKQHPLPRIAKSFGKLDESELSETAVKCLRLMGDNFENNLGFMHWTTLSAKLDYVTLDSIRELLQRCEAEIGVYDFRTFKVRLRLIDELLNERRYQQARHECHCLLATAHTVQPPTLTLGFQPLGLFYLAHCQIQLQDRNLAVTTLREAIDVCISAWGSADIRARTWIIVLREWLIELRREEEVEEVQL